MRKWHVVLVFGSVFAWVLMFVSFVRADDRSLVGQRIPELSVEALDGGVWRLDDEPADQGEGRGPLIVVAFLGTECPLAQTYGTKLAEMAARYRERGVRFVAVMSNWQDDRQEMVRFAGEQGIAFPIVPDRPGTLARTFGASRTPETFVVDRDRWVRYWGRIDDRFVQGGRRDRATREDLRIAIDELLDGRAVSVPVTEVVGCVIGRPPEELRPAIVEPPRPEPEITFASDVAPILFAKCARCHRPGQVAPFAMDAYEDIAIWAPTIKEAVRDRRMPPWGVAPGYGPFEHDLSLSDEQIATIIRWVDAGAPSGDLAEAPPFPEFGEGWQLGEPDLIVILPEYVVQPSDSDEWPTLSVEVPFPKGDHWIQAVEVLPGNPEVVHHLALSFGGTGVMGGVEAVGAEGARGRIGFAGDAAARGRMLRQLMQRRRQGGGGRGNPASQQTRGRLGAWAAGSPAIAYPEGIGIPITSTDGTMIFTAAMHYHPTSNTVERDQTKIGLYFGEGPLRRVAGRAAANFLPIIIPPGEAEYIVRGRIKLDEDIQIISYEPRMHFRGREMTYIAHYPNGTRETLLEVPRYDFNYQWRYQLVEPKPIAAGTEIEMIARLDNSASNRNNPDPEAIVRFGPESDDEMAVGSFMYFSEERVEPLRGDPGRRIAEWIEAHPEASYFRGTMRLGPIATFPMLLIVEPDGQGTLVMPAQGTNFDIPLGTVERRDGRVSADHRSGWGRTTVEGTLEGPTLEADIRIENNLQNPFMRMWNRGFAFLGDWSESR